MPNPIDLHVGKRVRQRRWALGLTQQQLAESIGIRFQQVQKYESGANRISASRLWDMARALQSPVSFFFEGLAEFEAKESSGAPADPQWEGKETVELLRAYYGLSEGPRRRLLELTKAMSAMGDQPGKSEDAA